MPLMTIEGQISEVLSGSLIKEQETDDEPCVYLPESTVWRAVRDQQFDSAGQT